MIVVIVAKMGVRGVIGVDGQLPWHIPHDLAFFKQFTLNGSVIMGRATWGSLPIKPLPNRTNVVVSTSLQITDVDSGVLVMSSID